MVLALLILALMPVEVFAKHTATVTNALPSAQMSTLTTFTLSVTCDTGSGFKQINQVQLVVDAQWTAAATGDQPTPPTGWSVNVVGNTITWSGSEIAVGGSQSFDWEATTAASAEYSSHSWTTTDIVGGTDTGTVETVVSDWDSYKNSDCTTWCDNFVEYATEHTVYMYGEGFAPNTPYRVVFWDEEGATWYIRDTVDFSATADGYLGVAGTNPVAHAFVLGTDTTGTWYVTVYDDQGYTPANHDPNDIHLVADDISYAGGYAFNVQQSAIPEFPTVIAAITVAGLCFGIYYWMRRRKLARAKD